MAVGTIYTELDIDLTKFVAKQKTLVNQIQKVGKESELALQQAFMNLGVTSDGVYKLMAEKARISYEKIAQSGKVSAAEQVRAQQAMVSQINAINAKMAEGANAHYATLGMKSAASINEQIANVTRAATAQQAIVGKSSEDWIRIERAKNEKLKQLNKEMTGQHEMSMASMTRAVLRLYAAYYIVTQMAQALLYPVKMAITYLASIETTTLGIAASFMTGGKFIDQTTGKVLEGSAALAKAQVMSKGLIQELQYANLQTIATLDQLIVAYQATLPVALAKGFNVKQVKDFTLAMVQAAGAIGLPMEQMAEETRSLLTGSINPRNSRIATVLGLRNEDIAKYKSDAQGLFDFLMNKLDAYKIAGIEAQNTWAGLTSNMKDIMGQFFGRAFDPLFEAIKYQIQEWIANVVTLDEKTKTITWNPAFLSGIEEIKSGINSVIAEAYRLGMLLDKFGGTISQLRMGMATIGNVSGISENKSPWLSMLFGSTEKFARLAEQNIQYKKNYLASDKALMDMAMREQGFKPSTADAKGATSVTTELGQILYYYKAINDEKTKYQTNGAKPDADAAKKAAEEQARLMEKIWKIQEDVSLAGLDGPRKAFEQNRIEAEKLRHELENTAGWNRLSKSQKDAAFSAIDSIQKMKDQGIVNTMVQKSREDNAKATAKETAETDKVTEAYNKLMNTVAPVTDRTYEMAKATEVVTAMFENGSPAWQAAIDKVNAYYAALDQKDAVSKIQKEADDARKMVTFYQDMSGMEDEYRKAKIDWIAKEAAVKFAGMDAEVAKAKWVKEQTLKFEHEIFDAKQKEIQGGLGDIASMFQTLSSMYEKNSSEANRMQELANVAIALQKTSILVSAVDAVAKSASLPPPAGFVSMAAMAAAMASLLATVGVSFGGGGSVSAPSAAYGQNTTVLGGANDQGSESIQKSWELLEDTYKMEDTKLTGIYNQMKDLNQNITGLVNNILRTGGDFTGMSTSQSGFAEENFAKITPNYWMNELSGGFYNKITFGISGAVDNFLGKIGNKIFGGSSETSLTASGISVGAGSLGDLINGTKLLVQSFADLRKETDGGWFHSDRTEIWTEYKTLDESISNMMTNVFKSMGTTMLELNKSLGTNANEAAIKAYQFDIGKIDLKGLDGEAISKKISEAISNVGDKMASDLFGSVVGTYQKINEGLLETAIRLVINKEVVLDTLAMTGQAFVGSTADIIAFSESIINMAGDLDALRTAAETYYDKFFTDAEKQARLQDQLIKGMSGVNQILPAARDGYRGLLESLDLNTDAGKEAYITMLKLAKSADEYYTALEDVAKKQDEVVASLRKQSQTITQWLSDLNRSPLAPSNSMEAVSTEYNRLKRLAKGTGATEADTSSYLNYAKEYLDYMRKYGGDYKALYASVVSDVQGLQSTIDTKVSDAQLAAATALSSAAALLGSAGNALINAATAQAIISAGGQATGYYSPKVGWTGGAQLYTTPGQTLQDAINNAIQMGYTQENPWAGGLAATATAEEVIANTTTNQDVWDWDNWSNSQTLINAGLGGYADGGYHEGGWRVVGERGPELEFTPPSRIFNNKQTKTMLDNLGLNGGSNGPGREEIHIHIHNETDGREVSEIIAKYIPRNGNLSAAIKKAAA